MTTIQKSVQIKASRERIWDVLFNQETFRDWGKAFHPDSYYEGTFAEGELVRFLGPTDEDGAAGMEVRVVEHVPGVRSRFEFSGTISGGKVLYEGESYDEWSGISEGYELTGESEPFTLSIRNKVPSKYEEMFSEMWDVALARIKEIAEG